MQLYKNRDFGQLFSDTFTFIKENGKHLFKTYFSFIWIHFVILLGLIIGGLYLFINEIGNIEYETPQFGILHGMYILVFMLYLIVFSLYNWLFTPIYFIQYKNHKTAFNHKAIFDYIHQRLGRVIKYCIFVIIASLILIIPLSIILIILTVTIIGIFFIPLVMCYFILLFNNTFIEYMETDQSFTTCLDNSFKLLKGNFFKTAGSNALIYIIIYIVSTMVTSVPYYVYIFSSSLAELPNPDNAMSGFVYSTAIFYIASFLLQLVSMILLNVHTNLVYYSLSDDKKNYSTLDEIDQIGLTDKSL